MLATNPFPGMNPWLETRWGDTHTSLVTYARNQLQRQLPPDLLAAAQENTAIATDGPDRRRIEPDVGVYEPPVGPFDDADEGGGTATLVAAPPTTRPLVLKVPSWPPVRRWVEIREADAPGRLVTVVEFLSPANKRLDRGRRQYLRKRGSLLDDGVSVVEVDLIRGGRSVARIGDADVPGDHRTPYRVCVYRGWSPDRVEFYRAPLRDRLPAVAVPLRETDPADVVLDLQPLVDAAYADGRWRPSHYAAALAPPLSPDDADWAGRRVGPATPAAIAATPASSL